MGTSQISTLSLLRAALLGTSALVLLHPVPVEARIGVTSATDGDPLGKPPNENERVLRIGIDVQANEVVTTGGNDRAHLVFLDGTSVTVGPNARLTIDKFVYDPTTKTGDLSITASKGVFRLVGGKISKTNPITVNTPSSTIGIRGGITIFTVTEVQTTSTFVFGQNMTVTGQGQTQTATRPGTYITTNSGGSPGVPQLVPQGGLSGNMGQLEGSNSQGGQGGTNQGPPDMSKGGPPQGGPPTGGGPIPGTNQPVNPNQNLPPSGTTTTQTQTTKTIVSRGRFLADSTYTSFNPNTLAAPRDPANNQNLKPSADVTTTTTTTTTVSSGSSTSTSTASSTISVVAEDGQTLVLPYSESATALTTITFTGSTSSGSASGVGVIGPGGMYFAYVLTKQNDGKKFGVFGGTPTTTSQMPTTGFDRRTMYNLGEANGIAFAPSNIANDSALKASATVSDLFSVYSPRLSYETGTGVPDQQAVSLQATISIAGKGSAQKSYMGGYIGEYFKDYNTDSYANAGPFLASYRTGASEKIGRITSSVTTADTGTGNAIYGSNAEAMVFMPDRLRTSYGEGGPSTERTPQLAYDQPYTNPNGTGYFTLNAALKGSTAPSSTSLYTRTEYVDKTSNDGPDNSLRGFVGGLVERRDASSANVPGNFTTRIFRNDSPDDVKLQTSPSLNKAEATIKINNWGSYSETNYSATFELGGITEERGRTPTSAYVDDGIYGMRDQRRNQNRRSHVNPTGSGPNTNIDSRTMLVSYNTAPVSQFFVEQGLSASEVCSCEFLTWGWWSGSVSYRTGTPYAPGETDRFNLATYVAGTMSSVDQLNAANFATSSATYRGHMVGNVQWGNNNYVAAGTYTNVWSYGAGQGKAEVKFDGLTYGSTTGSFNTSLIGSGPGFNSGNITSGQGTTLTLNGAFFSTGPNATGVNGAIGQAGNFGITGTRTSGNAPVSYQAGGTFAAQRTQSGN
jgi:hypothetical protein